MAATASEAAGKRVCIAFFSLTGNTRHVAEMLRAALEPAVASCELLDVTPHAPDAAAAQARVAAVAAADVLGFGCLAYGFREPSDFRAFVASLPRDAVVGKRCFVFGTNAGNEGRSVSNVATALEAKGARVVACRAFLAPSNWSATLPKGKPAERWTPEKHDPPVAAFARTLVPLVTSAAEPPAVSYWGSFGGYALSWACTDGAVGTAIGKIVCDPQKCVGCGLCARMCPRGAIAMRDVEDAQHQHRQLAFVDPNVCIRCTRCINICPHAALNSSSTLGRAQYVFGK